MPFCTSCGGKYDDEARFCSSCGKATDKTSNKSLNVTLDDVWETCEIYFVEDKKSFFRSDFMFEATAIGPKGRYGAAWSDVLKGGIFTSALIFRDGNIYPHPEYSLPMLDELIEELVTNGWESVGRGEEWYSEKFRRKLKA